MIHEFLFVIFAVAVGSANCNNFRRVINSFHALSDEMEIEMWPLGMSQPFSHDFSRRCVHSESAMNILSWESSSSSSSSSLLFIYHLTEASNTFTALLTI